MEKELINTAVKTLVSLTESKPPLCNICKEPGHPTEIEGVAGVLCDKPECRIEAEKRVECKQEDLHKERTGRAGIPSKYRDIESSRDYKGLAEKGGVYLYGTAGAGKTVLACSILGEHLRRGKEGLFRSAPKLVMDLQGSYREGETGPVKILNELSRVDVLLIDDLGAEKMTDFVRHALYYLINEREQWMKTTIITSNYSLQELNSQIDSRISSRIAGMCKLVNVQGEDRRLSKEEK